MQAGVADIDVALHLRCRPGEVEQDLVALDNDAHADRDVLRSHAIIVHDVVEPVFAVRQRVDSRTHAPRDGVDKGIRSGTQLGHRPALKQLVQAPLTQPICRNLRQIVAAPLFRDPHIQQDHVEHILDDFAVAHQSDRRDAQAFLIDLCHAAGHAAGCHPTNIRVVGDVGDEEDQRIAMEDRRDERHIWQMGAAADERVVGNEHIARTQIVRSDPLQHDFDQAKHRGEM